MAEPLRIGYADPPYPGQAAKHYADHPDYAGEVDHVKLLKRLDDDYDGWVLHTSSTALTSVLYWAQELGIGGYRVMAWVKPFAAFKRNVSVAYAWEPVLVKPVRKPEVTGRLVMRDWIAEPITMQRGLAGVKPAAVCFWLFEVLGARPGDELDDNVPRLRRRHEGMGLVGTLASTPGARAGSPRGDGAMTTLHDLHDMGRAVDEHDLADRRTQAEEAWVDTSGEPCTCRHDPEDHRPREGCQRRHCLCWWWGP